MSGNYFCHVCGGLVDLIKLQPSDVRLCECEKRFAQLRAGNKMLAEELNEQARLLGISAEKELALRAENERLKAELKSIDGALDDPRANLTLTTAEIIWEIKAELAEAKVDASNDCATCTYASLKEREIPCSKCVQEIKVYTNWKAAKGK